MTKTRIKQIFREARSQMKNLSVETPTSKKWRMVLLRNVLNELKMAEECLIECNHPIKGKEEE